jgi:hypothetical protein
MYREGIAQTAYQFFSEFKAEVLHQVEQLNSLHDGKLQDGFNPASIDDGWVSLKGFAWGFVLLYDEPVRLDMTFGPDWPFVGYRNTFIAKPGPAGLQWVNQQVTAERYLNAKDLANYGLRRLATKVGDAWIFNEQLDRQLAAGSDHLYGGGLSPD